MRIRIDDVRKAGYCVSGARNWFRANNIDFAEFIKNGMDADEFVRRGDELAKVVVDKKIERENG